MHHDTHSHHHHRTHQQSASSSSQLPACGTAATGSTTARGSSSSSFSSSSSSSRTNGSRIRPGLVGSSGRAAVHAGSSLSSSNSQDDQRPTPQQSHTATPPQALPMILPAPPPPSRLHLQQQHQQHHYQHQHRVPTHHPQAFRVAAGSATVTMPTVTAGVVPATVATSTKTAATATTPFHTRHPVPTAMMFHKHSATPTADATATTGGGGGGASSQPLVLPPATSAGGGVNNHHHHHHHHSRAHTSPISSSMPLASTSSATTARVGAPSTPTPTITSPSSAVSSSAFPLPPTSASSTSTQILPKRQQQQQQHSKEPNPFENRKLRSGKWIKEEEEYAEALIELFQKGLARDCENGVTLRSYLSKKLHCAPMRISKKYAGKGIGKMVFLNKLGRQQSQNPASGSNQPNDGTSVAATVDAKIPQGGTLDVANNGAAAATAATTISSKAGKPELTALEKSVEKKEELFMKTSFPCTDFLQGPLETFLHSGGAGIPPPILIPPPDGAVMVGAHTPYHPHLLPHQPSPFTGIFPFAAVPGIVTAQIHLPMAPPLLLSPVLPCSDHSMTRTSAASLTAKPTITNVCAPTAVLVKPPLTGDGLGGGPLRKAPFTGSISYPPSSASARPVMQQPPDCTGSQPSSQQKKSGLHQSYVSAVQQSPKKEDENAQTRKKSPHQPREESRTAFSATEKVASVGKAPLSNPVQLSEPINPGILVGLEAPPPLSHQPMVPSGGSHFHVDPLCELPCDMPDFLSGFDRVALGLQPAHEGSGGEVTGLGFPTDGQAGEFDHQYSPTFTSRSFDDFHRFLGKDLTTLDPPAMGPTNPNQAAAPTETAVGETRSTSPKAATTTANATHWPVFSADTGPLHNPECYNNLAVESAATGASQHPSYLPAEGGNSFDVEGTMRLVSEHVGELKPDSSPNLSATATPHSADSTTEHLKRVAQTTYLSTTSTRAERFYGSRASHIVSGSERSESARGSLPSGSGTSSDNASSGNISSNDSDDVETSEMSGSDSDGPLQKKRRLSQTNGGCRSYDGALP